MKAPARFVLACAACTALAFFGARVRASDFPQEQKGRTPQNQKDQTLKDKEKKDRSSQSPERQTPSSKKDQAPPEQKGKKPQNQEDQTPKNPRSQTPQDPTGQTPPEQKDQTWEYVKVIGVAEAHDSLDIAVALFNDCDLTRDQGPSKSCQQLHLVVKDAVVKERIKELQRGDRITVTFTPGDANQNQLKQFCIDKAPPVLPFTRVWVLLGCGFVCFIICYFCSRFHPLNLILGEDGRYSNSKFQIATWFFVLISTYLATVVLRVWYGKCDFIGGVNIPQNLLLLSGMSAITFAGAKGITASKAQNASQTPGAIQKTTAPAPSFWDLLQNDANHFDFGDFQMLIITLLATGMYLVLVFNFIGSLELRATVDLPNVDTTILATFGLGQGAYLAKKAAGSIGNS
jgi:hypothetical protein